MLVQAEGGAAHPDIHRITHLPKDDKEARKRDDGKPFELKRNLTIEQIRQLQQRLTVRPTMGDRRAVIIDPADDLERNAANALLKSLEEPPVGTVFLLVAHRPGRLLPTIRSRCRLLRFAPLSDAAVIDHLARKAPAASPDLVRQAVAASAGSPGMAERFVTLDLAPLDAIMRRILAQGDRDFTLRGELTGAMGQRPTRNRQIAALELARQVLSDHLRSAPRSAIPALADAHAALTRLSTQVPTYNFDPGLLVMEIGTLLASAAGDREPA